MRHFDLSPLYRSTVGFDRLFSMLDQVVGVDSARQTYPPYNIERTGENAYRITVAVAGFAEKDLSIEAKENTLTVKGEKQRRSERRNGEVLYRGIAARAFERRFQLADHVEVKGANLENGLLHVDLVREIPEAEAPPHRHRRRQSCGSAEGGLSPSTFHKTERAPRGALFYDLRRSFRRLLRRTVVGLFVKRDHARRGLGLRARLGLVFAGRRSWRRRGQGRSRRLPQALARARA